MHSVIVTGEAIHVLARALIAKGLACLIQVAGNAVANAVGQRIDAFGQLARRIRVREEDALAKSDAGHIEWALGMPRATKPGMPARAKLSCRTPARKRWARS